MVEIINDRKILKTPVTADDLADIRAGDVIYLTGELTTGRDSVHARVTEEGQDMPFDIRNGAIFHAGPIVRTIESESECESEDGSKDISYEMVSVGPTTSMRMERFEYDFISKTGVRIIIGKGGMKDRTAAACREFGAIHCILPAGNAVVGAECVEEICGVEWLDLGMPEAAWNCRVKEFGPLLVTIDTTGRNYFEEKKAEYDRRREEQLARIREMLHYTK